MPTRTRIKCADFFDYSDDAVGAGLGFYWQGGLLQGLARAEAELERDDVAEFTIPAAAVWTHTQRPYIVPLLYLFTVTTNLGVYLPYSRHRGALGTDHAPSVAVDGSLTLLISDQC